MTTYFSGNKNYLTSMYLGIVCPMANEQATVELFVTNVLKECSYFKQVTFFAITDKVCKDGTVEILSRLSRANSSIKVIWAPENRCVVDAYLRGYREALDAGCDWILEIDAGFSHRPEDLIKFFNKMSDDYDCIFGSRFCEEGNYSSKSLKRYVISLWGSRLARWMLGVKLSDMTSGFELFKRDALQNALQKGVKSRGNFFQTELKTFCRHKRWTEVPIHYSNPTSKVNASILLDSLKNLMRLYWMCLRGMC